MRHMQPGARRGAVFQVKNREFLECPVSTGDKKNKIPNSSVLVKIEKNY